VKRRRILFVAEAVTLAHVVRLVTLARSLEPSSHEILFATDPRYDGVIGALPFPVDRIRTITSERFFRALTHGTPIYGAADFRSYVEEDLKLLGRHRPDAVVGDFRLSLAVSARIARIPYINVSNAYWSPYAKLRHVVPEITLVRLLGLRGARILFDRFRPAAYAVHVVPVNRVRRQFGFAPYPSDFRYAIADGDVTLYCDVPEMIEIAPLPASHSFCGPIPWSPSVALPDWWAEVSTNAQRERIVYVTLGSSGPPAVFAKVLDALAPARVTVIAASVRSVDRARLAGNTYVAHLLPGDAAAQLAALVVCNGGSPTSYQALTAGRPVIGVATNTDQFLNMAAVEDAGCGKLLRAYHSSPAQIRDAVLHALEDPALADRAAAMRQSIARYSPATIFRTALDRTIASGTA